jgi:integrase
VLSHRRASYRVDATKRLRAYFAHLKDVPAARITRSDVVQAIDRVAAERGNTSARRGLAYARACCGWAVKRDLLADNPFSGAVAPGRENTRERVLSDTEIGAMWTHAASLGLIYGGYIRLLLLTLQRRSEVAGMRWDELNADFTIWTMPGNRTKNGRTHIVHMPEEGQQVLRAIYDIRQDSLVFPGRTKGKPISAFSRASMLLKQAEAKGNGAPAIGSSWWFHDIRRTGVTVLAREGFRGFRGSANEHATDKFGTDLRNIRRRSSRARNRD